MMLNIYFKVVDFDLFQGYLQGLLKVLTSYIRWVYKFVKLIQKKELSIQTCDIYRLLGENPTSDSGRDLQELKVNPWRNGLRLVSLTGGVSSYRLRIPWPFYPGLMTSPERIES